MSNHLECRPPALDAGAWTISYLRSLQGKKNGKTKRRERDQTIYFRRREARAVVSRGKTHYF